MYGGIYPGFLLRTGICGSSMITIYRTIRPSPATGTLTGRPPHDRQHIVRYCFQTLDGMGTGRGNALSSILVAPPNGVVRNGLSRAWAFGTVSEELVAHYPAGGQPVVTRRETEAASGESRAARKRKRPLEVPLKRAVSLATPATKNGNTAGAKATAGGKTPRNRKRQTKRPTLPGEPKPHASTTGEAHPL